MNRTAKIKRFGYRPGMLTFMTSITYLSAFFRIYYSMDSHLNWSSMDSASYFTNSSDILNSLKIQ